MNKKPIINIIQQQALQTPENVALVCDAASYTYLGTLSTGGTLYIIPEDVRFDFVRLAQFIDDNAITHIIMSTMTGHEFVTMHQCPSLRYLSVGGEKLNPVTPISGLTFVNIYGSSEACGMAPYISYRTMKVPTGGVQGVQLKDKHIEYIDAYNLGGWKVSNMSAKGIYISKNKKHY